MMIVRYMVFYCGRVYIQTKWLHRSEEKGHIKLDQVDLNAAKSRKPPAIECLLKTTRLGATAFSVVIELHEKPQNLEGRSESSSSFDLPT